MTVFPISHLKLDNDNFRAGIFYPRDRYSPIVEHFLELLYQVLVCLYARKSRYRNSVSTF